MAGGEVTADERPAAAAAAAEVAEYSDLVESAAPEITAAGCAEASDPEITARQNKGLVDWILNRKWVPFEYDPDDYYNQMINDPDRPEEYTQEYLEQERETMRELVAHNKRSRESFERFQEWVRRQLDEKGYVEVGESYVQQCAINRRSISPELWSALMGGLMGGLKLDEDDDVEGVVKPGAGGITVESN